MVAYLMVSLIVAIIGGASVMLFLRAVLTRAERRRELARRGREISSQKELEEFIRRVDQVTTDEQLDHLDLKKKEEH